MATEAIKSTPITNFDATPAVRPKGPGLPGNAGRMLCVDAVATFATAMDAASTYRMVRIPSNAIVKRVIACIETAVTTFTVDIGVYYDSSVARDADLRSDVIDADLFASAVALAAVVVPTEYTMESTVYSCTKIMQPLWQAAGLSADPGGLLDIVATATATSSGTSDLYVRVEYVLPGA